jgi:hypothetical protein
MLNVREGLKDFQVKLQTSERGFHETSPLNFVCFSQDFHSNSNPQSPPQRPRELPPLHPNSFLVSSHKSRHHFDLQSHSSLGNRQNRPHIRLCCLSNPTGEKNRLVCVFSHHWFYGNQNSFAFSVSQTLERNEKNIPRVCHQ